MNIKILKGMSSYFLSTLPNILSRHLLHTEDNPRTPPVPRRLPVAHSCHTVAQKDVKVGDCHTEDELLLPYQHCSVDTATAFC